jgi:hypothetical protein
MADDIEARIAAAVVAEREACARFAETWACFTGCRAEENTDGLDPQTRQYARGHYHARRAIADGIRGRGVYGDAVMFPVVPGTDGSGGDKGAGES